MEQTATDPAPKPQFIRRQARGGANEYQATIKLNGIQHVSTWYSSRRKAGEWATEKVEEYGKATQEEPTAPIN